MVFTRGMFAGMIVIALGLIAAAIWIGVLNYDLDVQQHRADQVLKQHVELVHRNARTITLICKLATGLSLNQPNLDPHFLRILNEIVGELPKRCFP